MKWLLIFCSLFSTVGCGPTKVHSNSATKQPVNNKTINMNTNEAIATFGGGCYWCMEAYFQRLDGVVKVESGFSGGNTPNPTYREVCSGMTGHAEVIQITYDTSIISFAELLKVFFTMHDPATLNRQGNDIGTQYRSVIFYQDDVQKKLANEIIEELNKAAVYDQPIVTEVSKWEAFYKAADYHQNYYNDNPNEGYCRFVIQPKLEKFEKVFKDKLKK